MEAKVKSFNNDSIARRWLEKRGFKWRMMTTIRREACFYNYKTRERASFVIGAVPCVVVIKNMLK